MTTKNTVSPVWCDARDDPLTTERENLPADRKTPSSLQRNSLHVWRGCVQWGLISTQVRSERKRPKESELKSCSCFITQRQVPRTAINYQPTSRRQSPLFPPRPQQLASIPVQTAVCQRLIYTRVFCVYVIFSSILILTQNNTNVSGWNGFCSWKGKIGHGVMRPQLRGTVRGAAGRQIKYWILEHREKVAVVRDRTTAMAASDVTGSQPTRAQDTRAMWTMWPPARPLPSVTL